jgi:S-adenosylmethionine synthetase
MSIEYATFVSYVLQLSCKYGVIGDTSREVPISGIRQPTRQRCHIRKDDVACKAKFPPLDLRGFFMVFTSESVCSGHPDKICDRISDSILDAVLADDPKGRVAVETLVTENRVVIAGEVTSKKIVDYESIARNAVGDLGYTDTRYRFDTKAEVTVLVHSQSPEIAEGVDTDGAGDQGMMFGYACTESKELMPLPILLAHRLAQRIDQVRQEKILPYLRPDGKTQVGIEYKKGVPVAVDSLVLAVPHDEERTLAEVSDALYKVVVTPVLSEYALTFPKKKVIVNGTGVWHIGGPASDTGLTGRKIIVDTYGGYARVGGGAFSGKDPTKVDRSGAYAARFIAKNIVAQKLAEKAEVRLSYSIGLKKPLMQEVETFGTSRKSDKVIADFVENLIDTSVRGIIDRLDLRRPLYAPTSAYGHFGREGFPWEEVIG